MEIKYYNLERIKTTYRVINGVIIHSAVAIFFSPQIKSLDTGEFAFIIDTFKDEILESDEQTFLNRIDEVAKLTKEYING